jgi:hypothetical protein
MAAVRFVQAAPELPFEWQVVVNNGVTVPGDTRKFNSYNQPSLNVDRLVVFRARSKGGTTGEPAHGVFTRDMALGTALHTVFDRKTLVPDPNNLGTTIVEPPSFPRIDMWSNTVASRGNHPPVWNYMLPDGTEAQAGTTGIYTTPFHGLIAGMNNLGAAPGFGFMGVPGRSPVTRFDVFPGAPAVTDGTTIVFKGNYSVPDPVDPQATIGKTGVYYRVLMDAPIGGGSSAVLIAGNETVIPGTSTNFGSTAPPSAARGLAVFAGFDDEWNPTAGGIYLAPLTGSAPPLTPLVEIGDAVPGESAGAVFNRLGEGVSFDGRFLAFWGAWGTETSTAILQCRDEGNKDRVAYCKATYPAGYPATVPVHQGIFVHDIATGRTLAVAKAPNDFTDFVFWNFSGMVPGMQGHPDDTGEPARWRSASFAAVSGLVDDSLTDPSFHTIFKARTGQIVGGVWSQPTDGVYLRAGTDSPIATVVETGMDGTLIDPAAVDPDTQEHLPVTEMGIEREGFRGRWLAINVSMGSEEAGWAGIYLTTVPVSPTGAPTIERVTPGSGGASMHVTISGSNLGVWQMPPAVSFGGVPADSVYLLDENTLDVVTPQHVSGATDVTITRPDGQSATLKTGFTFLQTGPPRITAQPRSRIVRAGGIALFSVAAASDTPIAFQWQLSSNGGRLWTNIPDNRPPYRGATTALLTVNGSSPQSSGTWFRAVLTNASGSTASLPASLSVLAAPAGMPGDFDGDGITDIAVYRSTTGEWLIHRSSDGGLTDVVWGSPGHGDVPAPADYDGDARTDIAVYRGTTGEWFILRSSDAGLTYLTWGSPADRDVPVPDDFDADGRADVAVYRPATSEWLIARSSDGGATTLQWGSAAAADVYTPGDFDGDTIPDVAVYRASTGEWFVRRSSDQGLTTAAWGSPSHGDVAVPGDYDGDGVTDFAVYRSATGEWFVHRSWDDGTTQVAWGSRRDGDVPVPQDYDADGRTDIAVYRPSTGEWFVARSSDGGQTKVSWGAASGVDRPVRARF